MTLAQELQDEVGEGWLRYVEGLIGYATERWGAAIGALRLAVERLRPANDDLLANVLCDLGATLALAGGELDEAIAFAEEGRARHRAVGNQYAEGLSFSDWGVIFEQRGDLQQALATYAASLCRLAELDEAWYVTSPLAGIASIAARHGASLEAVRLLAAVDRIRREVGSLTFAFEEARDARARGTAEAALEESAFARAWSAGQALDRFAAVDEGLAVAAQLTAQSPSSER